MELVVYFPYIRLAKIGNPRSCSCCHCNYRKHIKLYYWIIKNYALLSYSCSITCWTWRETNGFWQGRTLRHSIRYIIIFYCLWHGESNGNSSYLFQCGVYLLIGVNEAGFQSLYILSMILYSIEYLPEQ